MKCDALKLGVNLCDLINDLPELLVSAEEITGMNAPGRPKATFRLAFESGLTLKGRRLRSADDAANMMNICSALGSPPLSEIMARNEEALLEKWVDGTPLNKLSNMTEEILAACGEVLGTFHTTSCPGSTGWGPVEIRKRIENFDSELQELERFNLIPMQTRLRLTRRFGQGAPRRADTGFMHGDFCAENIVMDTGQTLRVIDNGSLSTGPLEEDLGRTFSRWPMDDRQKAAFLAGYSRHRDPAPFLIHSDFWIVGALAHSAVVRARTDAEGAEALALQLDGHVREK
jgi:aminoglycoside phosphotransferase